MFIFSYFIILISTLALDGMWLTLMVKRFYIPNIGFLFKDSIIIWPAAIFYILFGIALNVFIVLPALKNNTGYLEVMLLGLLFGMVTYGAYDLTNHASVKNWPWIVTVVDMAWGSILASATCVMSTWITRYFW